MSLHEKHWEPKELLLRNAEHIGAAQASRDHAPNYRAPREYAHDRQMHDRWLRGYSRIASVRWDSCVKVP